MHLDFKVSANYLSIYHDMKQIFQQIFIDLSCHKSMLITAAAW